MVDNELQHLPDWRFVPIDYGTKAPKVRGWQLKPYQLKDIPQDKNIGVILGPASNGLLAIDFDGPWAWDYWLENIQIPFESIDTVMWTSNKPGRCQMAFNVPVEFWQHMPAKFAISGPKGTDGKPQQLEFRWGTDDSGCQSVLPPSLHPDNKVDPNINYAWLRKPSEVDVMEIPVELLEWIYDYKVQKETFEPEIVEYVPKTIDGEEANKIAEKLKQYYPTLSYDDWIRVTWGFCNSIGYDDGMTIMKYYYPEEKAGEYKKLMTRRHSGRVCTIGTIIKMIKDKGGTIKDPTPVSDYYDFKRQLEKKYGMRK